MPGAKLIMQLFLEKDCITTEDARKALAENGYSPEGAWKYLYLLRSRGIVYAKRLGNRKIYCIYPEKKRIIDLLLKMW